MRSKGTESLQSIGDKEVVFNGWLGTWKQVQYFCKDHRNKNEVPDPIVNDLISDNIKKRNKSKADLTGENWVYLNPKSKYWIQIYSVLRSRTTLRMSRLLCLCQKCEHSYAYVISVNQPLGVKLTFCADVLWALLWRNERGAQRPSAQGTGVRLVSFRIILQIFRLASPPIPHGSPPGRGFECHYQDLLFRARCNWC